MTPVRKLHTDAELISIITTSLSFQHAGDQLGLSPTAMKNAAKRLGVRTMFRLGVERLPNDPDLARLLRRSRSIAAAAEELGITPALMKQQADRLGIDARQRVREGLPDDETLHRMLWQCVSFAALAADLRVELQTVRNQAKRLKVPAHSKRNGQTRIPLLRAYSQPRIPARDGLKWINSRYDHGALPEGVYAVFADAHPDLPRPRVDETAIAAAFKKAKPIKHHGRRA